MRQCKEAKEAPVNLVADVAQSLERVAGMSAEAKARAAQDLWAQVLTIQSQVAELRAVGVQEMRDRGDTLAEVGEVLDLSVTRVAQIVNRVHSPRGDGHGPH